MKLLRIREIDTYREVTTTELHAPSLTLQWLPAPRSAERISVNEEWGAPLANRACHVSKEESSIVSGKDMFTVVSMLFFK